MRISKKLPQFGKSAALLVVMGKQVAEFYLAKNREIELLSEFSVESPHYSDREVPASFPYEAMEQKLRQDFNRTLKVRLGRIAKSVEPDELYLFVPGYLHAEVVSALPGALKGKLKGVIAGTYYREHPFLLLERLQLQTA